MFLFGYCIPGARAWQSDNEDGTLTNPPLYADYPDPDVIRVGDDFYLSSTTFVNMPGVIVMHSKDLVNWEFARYVVPRLEGRKDYDLDGGSAYENDPTQEKCIVPWSRVGAFGGNFCSGWL